jgi:type VI secretion system protein ImpE
MNANELLKAGRLAEAIAAQTEAVRTRPADREGRIFLFELLAFAGDLERARRQIDAVRYDEAERDATVQTYRNLVRAEEARRALFTAGQTPQFLLPPPEHVRLRLEAVNRLRENRPAEAAELLFRASESVPPLHGTLNGRPFDLLRDADDLFGPVLEVLVHGEYYWVPLDQVETLTADAPQYLRDLLWFPARLALRNGPAGNVHLPALYPGSHEHPDDQIKLGHATDWKQNGSGPVLGVGRRTFLVGEDGVSLLEWRALEITESPAP